MGEKTNAWREHQSMSWESWAVIVQAAATVIAAFAILISYRALRDARAKAGDIEGGMHMIAYRDHVWNLYKSGLEPKEIEEAIRKETIRPGVDIKDGNAYDGFRIEEQGKEVRWEEGYKNSAGRVADLLDPLEQRNGHGPPRQS
jgi:hypothetical protein